MAAANLDIDCFPFFLQTKFTNCLMHRNLKSNSLLYRDNLVSERLDPLH